MNSRRTVILQEQEALQLVRIAKPVIRRREFARIIHRLDDVRRDQDDQFFLLATVIIGPERAADHRDLTQSGHRCVSLIARIVEQTSNRKGLPTPQHNRGRSRLLDKRGNNQ